MRAGILKDPSLIKISSDYSEARDASYVLLVAVLGFFSATRLLSRLLLGLVVLDDERGKLLQAELDVDVLFFLFDEGE